MALPCSYDCSKYCEGCHKTCAYWAEQRYEAHRRSVQIQKFLKDSNEVSELVARQLSRYAGGSCLFR